jgi:hypothetical protein
MTAIIAADRDRPGPRAGGAGYAAGSERAIAPAAVVVHDQGSAGADRLALMRPVVVAACFGGRHVPGRVASWEIAAPICLARTREPPDGHRGRRPFADGFAAAASRTGRLMPPPAVLQSTLEVSP